MAKQKSRAGRKKQKQKARNAVDHDLPQAAAAMTPARMRPHLTDPSGSPRATQYSGGTRDGERFATGAVDGGLPTIAKVGLGVVVILIGFFALSQMRKSEELASSATGPERSLSSDTQNIEAKPVEPSPETPELSVPSQQLAAPAEGTDEDAENSAASLNGETDVDGATSAPAISELGASPTSAGVNSQASAGNSEASSSKASPVVSRAAGTSKTQGSQSAPAASAASPKPVVAPAPAAKPAPTPVAPAPAAKPAPAPAAKPAPAPAARPALAPAAKPAAAPAPAQAPVAPAP